MFFEKGMLFSLLIILSVILSGCLYPQDKLAENQVPYEDQVKSVQSAVDRFQKDNGGILPIKTRDASTPIYQKYPIDFQNLCRNIWQNLQATALKTGDFSICPCGRRNKANGENI